MRFSLPAMALLMLLAPARAEETDGPLVYSEPRTYKLKIAIKLSANAGVVRNATAVAPIPIEWPEQKVKLLSEEKSSGSTVREQVFKDEAGMLRFQVRTIPAGQSASVERIYEVTRYKVKFTVPPEELKLPKAAPRELRRQLAGPSPGIDVKHPTLVELAKTLQQADDTPWQTTRRYFDWVRDNVIYENDAFRGSLYAVQQRRGDCEEMSALFVTLCRVVDIPARSVWVEGHDYPEFYLLDGKGKGHWIPAQMVGPAWFGEMADYRPIFQKGDRFRNPFTRKYDRHVPQTLTATGSVPQVQIVKQILSDQDVNGAEWVDQR